MDRDKKEEKLMNLLERTQKDLVNMWEKYYTSRIYDIVKNKCRIDMMESINKLSKNNNAYVIL
jgi:hypothetical protein